MLSGRADPTTNDTQGVRREAGSFLLRADPLTGEGRTAVRGHTVIVLTDLETWRPPTKLNGGGADAATPAAVLIEDDDLPATPAVLPSALTADERLALMERLEREALTKRFGELDRRSEELAAEQQRRFAARLDAAIAIELEQLRERRVSAIAELDAWAVAERARVTGELAVEERRFGERLMAQLSDFEAQLGERLREQEQKLAGWWTEAERLADERMRSALRDGPTA